MKNKTSTITIKTQVEIKDNLLKFLKSRDMTISEASNLLYVFISEKKRFPKEIENFLEKEKNEKYGLFKSYLKDI